MSDSDSTPWQILQGGLFNLADERQKVADAKIKETQAVGMKIDLAAKSIDWISSLPPVNQLDAYNGFRKYAEKEGYGQYVPPVNDPQQLADMLNRLKWVSGEAMKRYQSQLQAQKTEAETKNIETETKLAPQKMAETAQEHALGHQEFQQQLHETARQHDIGHSEFEQQQSGIGKRHTEDLELDRQKLKEKPDKPTQVELANRVYRGKQPNATPEEIRDGQEAAGTLEEYAKSQGVTTAKRAEATKAAQTKLSDDDKLMAQEVADGKVAPSQLSKRTTNYNGVMAEAFRLNPNLNAKLSDAEKSLMSSPGYRQRGEVLEVLPELVRNVVDAGKKLQYSKAQLIGKGEKWWNGQTNDPDYVNYMTQRNDIIMTLANVMRGAAATDQAQKLEDEALHPTLDPPALESWMKGQLKAAEPRIRQYERSVGGVDKPINTYKDANDVKAAVKSGQLSEEDGVKLLTTDFKDQLK